MEPGEKELRKVFEETTNKNIKTVIEYSKETRKLIRELQEKVILLEGKLRQYDEKLEFVNKQLNSLQSKIYKSGT